ncbi:MAG: PIN domain-containing protein [Thermomicrobiales bacterium]
MTTAIDTNVLVALWAGTPAIATAVQQSLRRARERGPLLVAAPVFAELIAAPQWTMARVEQLLGTMQLAVDWQINEAMWRLAGAAYRDYADRRRAQRGDLGPRGILADFVIGAHAACSGSTLLTSDQRLYRTAFPNLHLELIEEPPTTPEDQDTRGR